ncbi:3-methyladenine DNA glycosylase [Stieleria bergensis]|uniref:Putative 3-methyladenine DNA glycosylase n=1 Tax=Stieleria bergensis TaxID=2528025 RepID=A0A517SYK0_9BACT|nr:3-methyladenine DNA glycosylase [Planctomycetes bacterium SV_7m_r]
MQSSPSEPPIGQRLQQSFYDRPTATVARELIGMLLLHRLHAVTNAAVTNAAAIDPDNSPWLGGRIVETEAYLAERDLASHSSRGLTPSNRSMFQAAGTFYVYPIHAKHCLNAVTEANGVGAAVLIRAIEPLWGLSWMQTRRGQQDPLKLTRGPAMLAQALAITRDDDGRCLVTDPDLGIFSNQQTKPPTVKRTVRIGVSKSKSRLLRFVDQHSKYLSRPFSKRR